MLSNKELIFIDNYMLGNTQKDSAIKAGYSVDSAYQMGYKCLQKPEVQSEIQRRKDEMAKTAILDIDVYRQKTYEAYINARAEGVKFQYWHLLGDLNGFLNCKPQQTMTFLQQIVNETEDSEIVYKKPEGCIESSSEEIREKASDTEENKPEQIN